MTARYINSVALFCYCVAPCVGGSDDPLLNITSMAVDFAGYKYVWSVPQSRLGALPHCNPAAAEVPISPHQAIVAATEFMRTQFPSTKNLRADSVTLLARGIEKNPIASEVWIYEIGFLPDKLPPDSELDLFTAMVLMDGKVVVPVKTPIK